MNDERITIISADVSCGRNFVLVHSDDFTEQGIAHGFVIELSDGSWNSFCELESDLRHILVMNDELLANSTEEIYRCPLKSTGQCSELDRPENLVLINRIVAGSGEALILSGDGKVYVIREGNKKRIGDYSDGIKTSSVLMNLCLSSEGYSIVGMDGTFLLRRKGRDRWEYIDLATNVHLTGIACRNGEFYVCGFDGLLIRGDLDEWVVIENDFEDSDFWDVAFFNDALYILSETAILKLDGEDNIIPVYMLDRDDGIFHTFTQNNDVLWAVGEKDIIEYDGDQFKIILEV